MNSDRRDKTSRGNLLRMAVILLVLPLVFMHIALSFPRAAQAATFYQRQRLEQLVAPIALYPDSLLGQILMASTYPQEVMEALRWRNSHYNLYGRSLADALAAKSWDPSVKGLTAFPQVLRTMGDRPDWMENLGEAFLADSSGVMDAVQSLRHEALNSRTLVTDPRQLIRLQDGEVYIEPASDQYAYVPYYDPSRVFSPWPWPDYAPYSFGQPYGVDYYGNNLIGYLASVVIVDLLWNWNRCDWRHHRIDIDRRRWHDLHGDHDHDHDHWRDRDHDGDHDRWRDHDHDGSHTTATTGVWTHDPAHRHGVPYKDKGLRAHFETTPPDTQRGYRGYDVTAPRHRESPTTGVSQSGSPSAWESSSPQIPAGRHDKNREEREQQRLLQNQQRDQQREVQNQQREEQRAIQDQQREQQRLSQQQQREEQRALQEQQREQQRAIQDQRREQQRVLQEQQRALRQQQRAAPPMFESIAPGRQVREEAARGNADRPHVQREERAPKPARTPPVHLPGNQRQDDAR